MKLSNYIGLPQEEYDALYWKLREKNDRSLLGRLSLSTRQKLHPIFLAAYRIMNRLHGLRIEVKGGPIPSQGPLIFAATHVGKYDVEAIGEAVRSHFYLLSGDFENLQGGVEQVFLNLNGVLYFNEKYRPDRKAIAVKMVAHLRSGGNILYYPEGAWNFSPNRLVQPLYPGIIRITKEGGARIVPIGVEQYEKRFIIHIGKPMDVDRFPDVETALDALQDELASLKWEIWEAEATQKRELLRGNEWEQYIDERLAEWPGFDREHIAGLVYRPKGVTAQTEVFAHLDKLIPHQNNAFLFSKQNHQ